MCERLVHREIQSRVDFLHSRSVQRTAAVRNRGAAAGRTAPGGSVRAFLEQQQLHAGVRGGLQRLLPTRRRPPIASRFLAPALDGLRLVLGFGAFENRRDSVQELGRACLRPRGGPADEGVARLRGELVGELRTHLFGAHEHDLWRLQAAPAAVQFLGHAFQVFVDEVFDVAAIPRLRPAALVVLAGLFIEVLDQLLEASRAQPTQLTLLATDDRHDRPIGPGHERHERRELEVSPDLHLVGNGLG